jgi:hypothetical protein
LYSSPNIVKSDLVKKDEMGRSCAKNGKKSNAYRLLVEKPHT